MCQRGALSCGTRPAALAPAWAISAAARPSSGAATARSGCCADSCATSCVNRRILRSRARPIPRRAPSAMPQSPRPLPNNPCLSGTSRVRRCSPRRQTRPRARDFVIALAAGSRRALPRQPPLRPRPRDRATTARPIAAQRRRNGRLDPRDGGHDQIGIGAAIAFGEFGQEPTAALGRGHRRVHGVVFRLVGRPGSLTRLHECLIGHHNDPLNHHHTCGAAQSHWPPIRPRYSQVLHNPGPGGFHSRLRLPPGDPTLIYPQSADSGGSAQLPS